MKSDKELMDFIASLLESDKTKTKDKVDIDTTVDLDKKDSPLSKPSKAKEVDFKYKTADKDITRQKTSAINPDSLSDDDLEKLGSFAQGLSAVDTSNEPDLEVDTELNVVPGFNDTPQIGMDELPNTPENLPDILRREMTTLDKSVEIEWHMVKHLPGYMSKAIRVLGRQLFSAFTSTPIEDIQVLANLKGSGPNSPIELNIMAAWLKKYGQEDSDGEVTAQGIFPGYGAEIKVYRFKGYTFLLVRDFMGDYIYSWPESDKKLLH